MINDSTFIQHVSWMLNLFENDNGSKFTDYRSIYRYNDGNSGRRQLTLGRGFTEDGGNLKKVVDLYVSKGGKSSILKDNASKIGKGVLVGNTEFIKALRDAAAEEIMQQAQDETFRQVYLQPALDWAHVNGFETPLSTAAVCDSFLHSGTMTSWLVRAVTEQRPSKGGNEKEWIKQYCEGRQAWFKRSSGPLSTCQFRPKFFLKQMSVGNWDFNCPLVIPEKGTIC